MGKLGKGKGVRDKEKRVHPKHPFYPILLAGRLRRLHFVLQHSSAPAHLALYPVVLEQTLEYMAFARGAPWR